MLTSLHLQGFKSFYDRTLNLNTLTVLTGLNSSGKSSVIQSLRMVDRMCRRHSQLLPGYGDYKELKNKSYGGPCCIKIDDDLHNSYVCGEDGSEIQGQTCPFPKLIYVSASRLGPQPSIPVYAEDNIMDELGQNVLKCIEEFGELEMNPVVVPENAELVTFEGVIKSWLKIISPTTEFSYEIKRVADASYSLFNEHRAMNVGFGLSYSLPIITALLLGTIIPHSIVVIENPEAHLHAKAQTEMAYLIGKCVQAGAQVIVETHSDHLLDGLRIHIKRNPGFEQKMNTYWMELDETLNTSVQEIKYNSKGRNITEDIPVDFCNQFEYNAKTLLFGK